MNTNKQRIIAAVWENPGRAFGGQWKQGRECWEYLNGGEWKQRGAVRLLRSRDGEGITVFFNHGSGRAGDIVDVFDYFADRDGRANFWETLRALADVYGLTLELSEQERETIRRAELARDVAASLIEALRLNPDGETARYIRDVRGLNLDGVHFGELTADSLKRAKNSLKNHGKTWDAADFEALGLTEDKARAGYNCVIPCYRNGIVTGFVLRNIKAEHAGPKYLYPTGWERPAYCDRLEHGTPAVIVEGQLDAVRLIQQGVKNVVAMGGAKPVADVATLLRSRGITQIVYIPDAQTDELGQPQTKITADAIRAFESLEVDGETVIKSVEVLELPTPQGANAKTDADSYGKTHQFPPMLEFEPVPAWLWEFEQLREQADKVPGINRGAFVQDAARDIYTRAGSPFVRDQIRQYVGRYDSLARQGVTPQALADLDEWNKKRDYYDTIQAAAGELNKAVQDKADAGTVAGIVRRLTNAQGADARAEWEKQLAETFDAELDEIRNAPDTLKTKWELFRLDKQNKEYLTEKIEFFPADISVFCAATSHGKTTILFEAALDLIRKNDNKTYLFVSCEENKRQLLQRALNVYLPIETTEKGRTDAGAYCFKQGHRKRAIIAALRGATTAPGYDAEIVGVSEHFKALKDQITRGVEAYGRTIRPRLKFVHTEAAAETICNNILHFVERERARGVEVGAVFVDYIQLLTTDGRNYSRTDELKEICKALKDCAARAELPIIIAAQLNRQVLQQAAGLDNITVANIGEGADVERIAHDIYLVWQTDKTPANWYTGADGILDPKKLGPRSRRLYTFNNNPADRELKTGYLYVEQLKARDGIAGGWGLFPFDGERGTVGENDVATMKK